MTEAGGRILAGARCTIGVDFITESARRAGRDEVEDEDRREIDERRLPTYSSWLNLIECQFQAVKSQDVV